MGKPHFQQPYDPLWSHMAARLEHDRIAHVQNVAQLIGLTFSRFHSAYRFHRPVVQNLVKNRIATSHA
jgi:ABC-type uncharacterized transport system permease subunit